MLLLLWPHRYATVLDAPTVIFLAAFDPRTFVAPEVITFLVNYDPRTFKA